MKSFLQFNAVNAQGAEIPKVSTSSSHKRTTIGSMGTILEQQKQILEEKKDWTDANSVISESAFTNMTCPNRDFGMCFLVIAAELSVSSS